MVIAYHLIWTAYGWWLPNDPRGSMSRGVASDVLKELGELHYGRRRVQPASKDIRRFYESAKLLLTFELRTFPSAEIYILGEAFAQVIARCDYTCYSCAIMPDHVHMLIRKHKHVAEDMIANLQTASREAILEYHLREPNHPVWGGSGWKVFLETKDDIVRTVRYIEQNPIKIGAARQRWDFVTTYDGWMPGTVRPVKRAPEQGK